MSCSSPRWESRAGSEAPKGCEGQGEGSVFSRSHWICWLRFSLVAKAADGLGDHQPGIVATWSRCPHHTGYPLHHPKLRVCCPTPAFCRTVQELIPVTLLDGSPSPPSILWAGTGIGFPPGSGRRVLDVNSLLSWLNFPPWPRRTRLPLAPRCRACRGRPGRLETPGSSSTIIGCDRNTLTRRPRCLQLICIANSI